MTFKNDVTDLRCDVVGKDKNKDLERLINLDYSNNCEVFRYIFCKKGCSLPYKLCNYHNICPQYK